jgi:hypothetical protein
MPDTNEITTKLLALAAKRFKREVSELNATDDFFEKPRHQQLPGHGAADRRSRTPWSIEIPDYEVHGRDARSARWRHGHRDRIDTTMIPPERYDEPR